MHLYFPPSFLWSRTDSIPCNCFEKYEPPAKPAGADTGSLLALFRSVWWYMDYHQPKDYNCSQLSTRLWSAWLPFLFVIYKAGVIRTQLILACRFSTQSVSKKVGLTSQNLEFRIVWFKLNSDRDMHNASLYLFPALILFCFDLEAVYQPNFISM